MADERLIMIADDDPDIREVVRILLESEGFRIVEAVDGDDAVSKIDPAIDLYILDVMMPGKSGYQVCRAIRAASTAPILFLTAKSQDGDKSMGFSSGGDDYLPKPFHLAELSARIRSVVRRHQRDGQQSLDVGNVRLYPDSRRVEVAGCEVELLRKEYDILYYFMSRPNHMVDKATLAEAVWGDHIDQADNFDFVYAQMKNLRRRLHDAQADIEIRAVYGFGYKLVAP